MKSILFSIVTAILLTNTILVDAQEKATVFLFTKVDLSDISYTLKNEKKEYELYKTISYQAREDNYRLTESFLYQIRKTGSIENKTDGVRYQPTNGLDLSFNELSLAVSKNPNLIKGNENLFFDKPYDNRATYDKVNKTYSTNNKIVIEFDGKEQINKLVIDETTQPEGFEDGNGTKSHDLIDALITACFFEKWVMDSSGKKFQKEVIQMGIGDNYSSGNFPLFNFATTPYTKPIVPKKVEGNFIATDVNLLYDSIVYQILFDNSSSHPAENGIVSDCEKTNYDHFIESRDKGVLLQTLFMALLNGKIKAYEYYPYQGINFAHPLTKGEVTTAMRKKEETYDYYSYQSIETFTDVLMQNIGGFIFHESWYLDKENFSLYKKVNGIVPLIVTENYDIVGNILSYQTSPLFYINFDEQSVMRKSLFPYSYTEVSEYSNEISVPDLSIFRENGKFGVLNSAGKKLIEPIYDRIIPMSDSIVQVQKGDKYGILSTDGKIPLPVSYSWIDLFHDGYAKTYIGPMDELGLVSDKTGIGKYGMIDRNGKKVIDDVYDDIEYYNSYGASIISQLGKKGIMFRYNSEKIPCVYDYVESLNENLFQTYNGTVQNDLPDKDPTSKYGLLDATGKKILPCSYDQIELLSGDITKVRQNNIKWAICNARGTFLTEFRYDYIGGFYEGIADVKIGELYGFIDSTGNEIVPCKYVYTEYSVKSGVIIAQDSILIGNNRTSKFGVLSTTGKVIIPFEHDLISLLNKGLFLVFDGQCYPYTTEPEAGKYSFYKTDGTKMSDQDYDWVVDLNKYFSTSRYFHVYRGKMEEVLTKGKFGMVDSEGKEIVPCKYNWIYTFGDNTVTRVFNGKMDVEGIPLKGKFAIIDLNGKELCPFAYDWIYDFYDGMAVVGKKDKYGYIDTTGKLVVPIQYIGASSFSEGSATVTVSKEVYIHINKKGEKIEYY